MLARAGGFWTRLRVFRAREDEGELRSPCFVSSATLLKAKKYVFGNVSGIDDEIRRI